MAEEMLDVRHLPRAEAYRQMEEQLDALLEGETDPIAQMATVACVLHHGLGNLWTGFYRTVAPKQLKIGPYQGTLGCLDIRFGKGVCGTAAAQKRTVLVPDVAQFPGHIACDARSRAEIVVPVFDRQGDVAAVLDLDSDQLGFYSEVDRAALERIVRRLAAP